MTKQTEFQLLHQAMEAINNAIDTLRRIYPDNAGGPMQKHLGKAYEIFGRGLQLVATKPSETDCAEFRERHKIDIITIITLAKVSESNQRWLDGVDHLNRCWKEGDG